MKRARKFLRKRRNNNKMIQFKKIKRKKRKVILLQEKTLKLTRFKDKVKPERDWQVHNQKKHFNLKFQKNLIKWLNKRDKDKRLRIICLLKVRRPKKSLLKEKRMRITNK